MFSRRKVKKTDGVIFVINTGDTTSDWYENESFLPRAKNVVRKFIEKKMFLCPHDEVAYICLGRTKMPEVYQDMQRPNWKMLRKLLQVESSLHDSSWPEGLHVAYEHLMKQNELSTLKIVLIHDFKEANEIMSQFNIDAFSQSFKQQVDYLFVGLKARQDMQSNLSEKLAIQFCERFNGQYKQLAQVEKEVQFFGRAYKNTLGMKVPMYFLDIKLPVQFYKLVDEASEKPKMIRVMARNTQYVSHSLKPIAPESIAIAFQFGRKLTTMTDEEFKEMEKKKEEGKNMKILGFLQASDINVGTFSTQPAKLVLPSKDSDQSQITQFFSFAQALQERKRVAIARLVLRDRDFPKMVYLFPRLDKDPQGIICIGKVFTERLYPINPGCIDENALKEENPLLDPMMSNLIDSGMLVADKDHEEPLALGTAFSPDAQASWNYLSHRALHGGDNLTQVYQENQRLKDPLRTPDYILQKSQESIDDLKKLDIFKTKAAIETRGQSTVAKNSEAVTDVQPMDCGIENIAFSNAEIKEFDDCMEDM